MLACGSMGGKLCWSLLTSPETSQRIDGAVFLGGFSNSDYASLGGPDRPRLFFGHVSDDPVYPVDKIRKFYETLKAKGQPV
jgi:predicted esterase